MSISGLVLIPKLQLVPAPPGRGFRWEKRDKMSLEMLKMRRGMDLMIPEQRWNAGEEGGCVRDNEEHLPGEKSRNLT